MIISLSAFLLCLILIGWAQFFAILYKTNINIGFLNAVSLISLTLFLGFLLSKPEPLVFTLSCLSLLFFIFPLPKLSYFPLLCFLLLSVLCLLLAVGTKFGSIDDYSFWGLISKYLYIFNALPHNSDYIRADFLSYTPAVACFHYFLFKIAALYSPILSYFAQGLLFIATLIIFADFKNISRSLINMSLMSILFYLAFGNVFARMQVDALVAAYFFIACWLIYKEGKKALAFIFIPLLFLTVIKEIGLLFAFFALILYILLEKPKARLKIGCFLLFIALLALKFLWRKHVHFYDFHSFSAPISYALIKSALNPFTAYYQTVQYLYLKEIFFANFDNVFRIPYIFFYIFIASLWSYLIKNSLENKSRINCIMNLFTGLLLIYLLMLYFLQAIVFDVGHSNEKILDFTRYYNMLFLPFLSINIFIALDIMKPKWLYESKGALVLVLVIALVFIIAGKIERMQRFYQASEIYPISTLIAEKAAALKNKNWSICIKNSNLIDHTLTMPLSYFFMPHRVYYPISEKNKGFCDMTLIYDNVGYRVE